MANETGIVNRVPPQNIDAEMALLGAMMLDKEAIAKAIEIVKPDDFYKILHREIFIAICDLFNKDTVVDFVVVSDKLSGNALFVESGGSFYITSLIDYAQTTANVEEYANIVKNKSLMRQLITAGSQIVEDVFNENNKTDGDDRVDLILDHAQGVLLNLAQTKEDKTIVKVGSLTASTLEHLARLHENKNDVPGLSTGFVDLDVITGGLQNSELIVIAARPSMGKTSFALNIAENVARKPAGVDKPAVPVLVFSLEMSSDELMLRMLSSISGVPLQFLRNGKFRIKEDWTRITDSMTKIADMPLYIDTSSTLNIMELRSRARRLDRELRSRGTQLGLVVVDYIQLVMGTGKYDANRVLDVGEVSRYLKALAKDLKIPVVALSQLSRAPEKRGTKSKENRPILSDLRDSGAIEQDADVVAFIHREWFYDRTEVDKEHEATIIIAKQRNGPVGDVQLEFDGKLTRFNNASRQRPPEGM